MSKRMYKPDPSGESLNPFHYDSSPSSKFSDKKDKRSGGSSWRCIWRRQPSQVLPQQTHNVYQQQPQQRPSCCARLCKLTLFGLAMWALWAINHDQAASNMLKQLNLDSLPMGGTASDTSNDGTAVQQQQSQTQNGATVEVKTVPEATEVPKPTDPPTPKATDPPFPKPTDPPTPKATDPPVPKPTDPPTPKATQPPVPKPTNPPTPKATQPPKPVQQKQAPNNNNNNNNKQNQNNNNNNNQNKNNNKQNQNNNNNNQNKNNNNNNNNKNMNQNQKNANVGPKPMFVVHVGPANTGTTIIERESNRMAKSLQQDKILYASPSEPTIGDDTTSLVQQFTPFEQFQDCIKTTYEQSLKNKWNKNELWNHNNECWAVHMGNETAHDRSIIVPHDAFVNMPKVGKEPTEYFRYISEFFGKQHGYNLTVVATYRYYEEWLLSTLQAINHPILEEDVWPKDGGRTVKHVWNFAKERMSGRMGKTNPSIDMTLPEFTGLGFSVNILDFETPSTKSVVESFYCDMIGTQTASRTCLDAKQHYKKQNTINNHDWVDHFQTATEKAAYDAVVVAAAERGYINTKKSKRSEARQALMDYHNNELGMHFHGMPLQCPIDWKLAELKTKILEVDDFVQQYAHFDKFEQRKESHIALFHQLAHVTKAFCWVNLDVLFKDTKNWNQVLEKLKKFHGQP